MGDAQHRDVELLGELRHRMQVAPGLAVLVAVAGDHRDHGIERDQLQLARMPSDSQCGHSQRTASGLYFAAETSPNSLAKRGRSIH